MPSPSYGELPSRPGRFVTFEGGEGAGKSTQIKHLEEALRERNHDVVVTREPGGSERAEAIRTLLLSGRAAPFGDFAEAVLFSAARSDHVRATIIPALSRGAYVLCDRFADSTRVYQGVGGRVPMRVVEALERSAVDGLKPDLTLILDCPVEIGAARAAARRAARAEAVDRFEARDHAFHEQVRRGFLAIAEREPQRCAVVDASLPPDEVARRIWAIVCERLGTEGEGAGAP